ncbi:zf-HC2 domain-containing protein [Dictyobacter aurantiacus]|uniref:Zinc-finger domain-containing protein n=1 Tax=Dictyobacter aurantiacus TaxID=1936993 RepID=A0A401ZJZ2_9CHLR|nr:zf-HC2 domain-containing protein [Dictyobacter aurantiacus]GCE07173.1 hypothetical protein KDAU_45020 [Dictyobacter aurantiacus]
MNHDDDRVDSSLPASDEHQTVTALLDAHATAELTEAERTLVERHLTLCQQCQQALNTITHLHSLLRMPAGESEVATLNKYADGMPEYRRGISALADSVLDRLAQGDQTEAASPIPLTSGQLRPDHSEIARRVRRDRKRWAGMLALVAAALCVGVLGIWCLSIISQSISSNIVPTTISRPAPVYWGPRQDQMVARHGQDVFALKYMSDVNELNWAFIYAFRTPQPGTEPQVKVTSSLPKQPAKTITIAASMRTLGRVGDFTMGVMYVRFPNRVGQSITLQGQFPDQATPWRLTIMDQLTAVPASYDQSDGTLRSRGWSAIDAKSFPEISQVYPTLNSYPQDKNAPADDQLLDFLGFTLSSHPKAATPLYVRVDYVGKPASLQVTTISYAEYLRLAGPQPTPTPRPTAAPGSTVHVSVDKTSYGRTDTIKVTIRSDFPYELSLGVPRTSCGMQVQLEMQVNGVWTPVGHCTLPHPATLLTAHGTAYEVLRPQNAFGWQQSATSWQPGTYRITTNYSDVPRPQYGAGFQEVVSPTFVVHG